MVSITELIETHYGVEWQKHKSLTFFNKVFKKNPMASTSGVTATIGEEPSDESLEEPSEATAKICMPDNLNFGI